MQQSLSKTQITSITKLHLKKYRDSEGAFLVEGRKGVEEAFAADAKIDGVVILESQESAFQDVIALARTKDTAVYICDEKTAQQIKTTDTFPGILAVVQKLSMQKKEEEPIIILDQINDPGNLGTIIRSADWFGIPTVMTSEGSVDLYNPKVVRSTMGSLFHINCVALENVVATVNGFQKNGYTIVAFGMDGEDYTTFSPSQKSVYIFGSESHGVRPELQALAEKTYTISGKGQAESLNVAISAGIVMSLL